VVGLKEATMKMLILFDTCAHGANKVSRSQKEVTRPRSIYGVRSASAKVRGTGAAAMYCANEPTESQRDIIGRVVKRVYDLIFVLLNRSTCWPHVDVPDCKILQKHASSSNTNQPSLISSSTSCSHTNSGSH
jgi:hypothetical protein